MFGAQEEYAAPAGIFFAPWRMMRDYGREFFARSFFFEPFPITIRLS